jgi:hypothetical protein
MDSDQLCLFNFLMSKRVACHAHGKFVMTRTGFDDQQAHVAPPPRECGIEAQMSSAVRMVHQFRVVSFRCQSSVGRWSPIRLETVSRAFWSHYQIFGSRQLQVRYLDVL